MSSRLSGNDYATLVGIFLATLLGLFLFYNSPKPTMPDSETGVLVLAHGGSPEWNKAVEDAVKNVRGEFRKEVAFGMADAQTIQPAIERLEKFVERINSRIDKIESQGRDTTVAENAMVEAKADISSAKINFEVLKTMTANISVWVGTSTATSTNATSTKAELKAKFAELREQVKKIKQNLKDAHSHIVDAVNSLKCLRIGVESNATTTVNATTTP